MIDESSPALFRFGLSFVVGFFLAFIFRKVITITLLNAGAIATAAIVLHKTNIINLDWDAVESQAKHGVDYARNASSNLKEVVLGYAPSSASAVAGLFFGARHRV